MTSAVRRARRHARGRSELAFTSGALVATARELGIAVLAQAALLEVAMRVERAGSHRRRKTQWRSHELE